MANEEVNTGRRRFLTATTAVVGAVGVGFAAVPFIKSWSPSARALFAGAPVTQDISALAIGAQLVLNWRGQPIYIARRTQAMLDVMKTL
ncbi:MAG: ubiquinol-cytochrome c reductase iron-sulfur subunit N-terminal domain-containing protein, partial [Thermomonas sp.]